MKIDSHQHFWKYSQKEYPWMGEGMEILAQDRLPSDLLPLIQNRGIDGTVAVQARQNLAETRDLLKMAQENDFIKGIVGWVEFCSPEIEKQLEEFSGNPKLVGYRHVVQDEPDERFVMREDFLNGIKKLGKYDLVYDILVFPNQLPASIEMVAKFPDQKFVLNHIAKPKIKKKEQTPWSEDILKLAAFENVFCKISGMVTEADWQDWKADEFTPYLDIVFEAFGTDRLMLGSDWPVCTLAAGYDEVMEISENYISKLSDDEQKKIWSVNPGAAYGLKN